MAVMVPMEAIDGMVKAMREHDSGHRSGDNYERMAVAAAGVLTGYLGKLKVMRPGPAPEPTDDVFVTMFREMPTEYLRTFVERSIGSPANVRNLGPVQILARAHDELARRASRAAIDAVDTRYRQFEGQ